MLEIKNTTIAHYQLERLLARGGMSNVYLAHDTHTDRTVAVKLVHTSESHYFKRFKREAKAIASLTHDHILPAFDYGEQGSWYYMVMPYIEYGTLRQRLVNGPLSPREAGKILTQLAEAVQFAHDRGIVHRDIKPSNILLRDGEHVYLADFGLVKHIEEMSDITSTGYILGTPEYMAPELIENSATPGSDIYALGIILYQMLTGHVPFKGSTPIGVCWKHLREQPAVPSTLNPNVSHAIDKVILQALEKNPQRRFKSANDLAQAYRHALKQEERKGEVKVAASQIHIPSDYDTAATLYHSQAPLPKEHLSCLPILTGAQSWKQPFRQVKKMHIGAIAVFTCLVLFILPTLPGFSFSHLSGHAQQQALLGASGSFINGHISTKPPITHPTPTAKNTSTPSGNTHPYNTYQPTVASSQNNSRYNNGTGGGDNQNSGHKHKHKHGHGKD